MEHNDIGEGQDTNKIEGQDMTLLKVSAKGNVDKLSTAIMQTFDKHGMAKLRCVGARACYVADKAIIIATGKAATKGIELVTQQYFKTISFGDEERSSVVKEVFDQNE